MSFPGLRVFIIWVSILVSIIEYGCNYHRLLMTAWISRVCPAKNVVVGVLILLLQSLDNLETTRGECLGRTRWSSPLDWTTYLYYFTSGCTLLVYDHMSFLECSTITCPFWNVLQSHDLVTWYDYISSHAIYILFSLYDLIFAIKCLNAWETFSFLGLS